MQGLIIGIELYTPRHMSLSAFFFINKAIYIETGNLAESEPRYKQMIDLCLGWIQASALTVLSRELWFCSPGVSWHLCGVRLAAMWVIAEMFFRYIRKVISLVLLCVEYLLSSYREPLPSVSFFPWGLVYIYRAKARYVQDWELSHGWLGHSKWCLL